MNVKKLALVLGVALALIGCTTGRGLVAPLPSLSNPAQAAKITVKRDRTIFGAGQAYVFSVDGQEYWIFQNGDRNTFLLDVGTHFFGLKCGGGWRLMNYNEIECKFDPGKEYYFRLQPDMSHGCMISSISKKGLEGIPVH